MSKEIGWPEFGRRSGGDVFRNEIAGRAVMTANVKQRILEKTIAALDPGRDRETIARLRAELALLDQPAAPPAALKASAGAGMGGGGISLTENDVADYRANGPKEVCLKTKWGMVYLVKERTGTARFELVPEDIVKIQTARRQLGADVVDLVFKGQALKSNHPEIG